MHRCWSQFTRFNLRNQVRGGVCVPLHVSDLEQIWEYLSKAKSDTFVSGAEGEVGDRDGRLCGRIHVI